jgi:hypothetical protein
MKFGAALSFVAVAIAAVAWLFAIAEMIAASPGASAPSNSMVAGGSIKDRLVDV